MTIQQTINIPPSHRLTLDVPPEVPAGPVILTFTPALTETKNVPDALAFRTGFLKGRVSVPPDFDTLGQMEIAALFGEHL
jgi:hypothetical protein